ncbi:VOC family protein [Jongsikchunia kroppenstedtii]|uniref:VOC family protein n=1 Tax=Jongsikchunia kroppenstedtii TaxID=1121721 RepID=UPI0003625DF4|nr:VOC family protein [Jongsikchunia kroppenstedtii]
MAVRWLSALLDFPADQFSTEVTFWRAIAGSTVSPPYGPNNEFASLEPFNGDPHLMVQRVQDGPGGVHLDLHVDDFDTAVARAQELGAQLQTSTADLAVLRSPAGFAFCLAEWHGQDERSRPIRWPGDTISIIDQLVIDVPGHAYDTETAFWADLTQWPANDAGEPGFRRLDHPNNITLRLLLQRVETGQIGAHLDLASTHPEDEVTRHEGWGAIVVKHYPHWTVMADPMGREYCITHRNPRTGKLLSGE